MTTLCCPVYLTTESLATATFSYLIVSITSFVGSVSS